FVDSHTHFQRASIAREFFLDFEALGAASVAEIQAAVAGRVAALPTGTWIQGDALVAQRLAEGRMPHRLELDAVAPDHPVVLRGIGRHTVVVNSLALRLAGISRDDADPPGGRIGRDADGELNGSLHERAKARLDMTSADTVIPRLGEADRLRAIGAGIRALHRVGIVGIHEMVREPIELGDYLRLREAGDLAIRVRFYVRSVESSTQLEHLLRLGLRSNFGDDWLRIGGVKLSVDGWEVLGTAATYDPYPGEPDNTGIIRIEPERLVEEMTAADRSGLQIAVHAAGPRAVDAALDAYTAVLGERPMANPLRHRIEHVYLPARPGQLERVARLGLLLSTQPGFVDATGDLWRGMYDDATLERAMPLRTLLDLGIPVQANSDYPCSPMGPWLGIRGAVARLTRGGIRLGAAEAITLEAAIAMWTTAPAWSAFEEGRVGTLAAGARADIITLTEDPFSTDPDALDRIEVATTILAGAVVHDLDHGPDDGAPAATR
ncbi:MAG TPA: amidohydrolase, partial [Candidatus Saccharimonadales bacterium]|nr:amidohydrolase [Candidatus Saccharimonadales bacterium]